MDRAKTPSSGRSVWRNPGHGRTRFVALAASIVLALLVTQGYLLPLFAVAGLVLLALAASRLPLTFIVGALLVGLVPQVFQEAGLVSEGLPLADTGLRMPDVFLVGMGAAAAYTAVFRVNWGRLPAQLRSLVIALALFVGWALVGVLRNVSEFGISAPGEFRFRYLILALPVFCALKLDTEQRRRRAVLWLAALTVPITLLAIPMVGHLQGWGIGPESRYLPAAISLALVYGTTWLLVARQRGAVKTPVVVVGMVAVVSGAIVLADSHRSVWVALLAVLIALVALGELRPERMWAWGTVGALLVGLVAFLSWSIGTNPISYIATRGRALVAPGEDANSYWRLIVWDAQLRKLAPNLLAGEGFGGYWDVYVPQLGRNVDISPHNLFVQTAVKLGIIGLGLYAWLSVSVLAALRASRSRFRRLGALDQSLVVTGIAVLAGSLAYHMVYALEYAGLMWIGLALAAALHGETERSATPGETP